MRFTRPLEQLVALGPEGRLILVDETSFRFKPGKIPEIKARLKVRDLRNGEEIIALSPRDLVNMQLHSMETDFAWPPVGSFTPDGTRLIIMRERPDCPMQQTVTMSPLPMWVPSCPDRRLTFSVGICKAAHGLRRRALWSSRTIYLRI